MTEEYREGREGLEDYPLWTRRGVREGQPEDYKTNGRDGLERSRKARWVQARLRRSKASIQTLGLSRMKWNQPGQRMGVDSMNRNVGMESLGSERRGGKKEARRKVITGSVFVQ